MGLEIPARQRDSKLNGLMAPVYVRSTLHTALTPRACVLSVGAGSRVSSLQGVHSAVAQGAA
jgi:hypothetical protein